MGNLEQLEKIMQEICKEQKDCAACVLCDTDNGKCFYGLIGGRINESKKRND